jgi:hypothetical protein
MCLEKLKVINIISKGTILDIKLKIENRKQNYSISRISFYDERMMKE